MLTIKDLSQAQELDSRAMSAVSGGHGYGYGRYGHPGNNNNNSGVIVGGDVSGVVVGGDNSGLIQNGDGNFGLNGVTFGDKSHVKISLS